MTLTTREAVYAALLSLSAYNPTLDNVAVRQNMEAARVLCEHYGFKLSHFFDEGIDK